MDLQCGCWACRVASIKLEVDLGEPLDERSV